MSNKPRHSLALDYSLESSCQARLTFLLLLLFFSLLTLHDFRILQYF